MGSDHVIIIERPAKLNVDIGRLAVSDGSGAPRLVACSDVAVLIIGNPAINLSAAVLSELAAQGAIVLCVDDRFMPVSMSLPQGVNSFGARRPHQQSALDGVTARKLWNQIIRSKIRGQSGVLPEDEPARAGLLMLADRIGAETADNGEGAAAKLYWEAFFRGLQRGARGRIKQGAEDLVNSALNYAYAIIRSAVARSLSGGGFCLNFGLGHCRKDNPFNLAEDFMEPFRCIGERAVLQTLAEEPEADALTSALKRRLAGTLLESEIGLDTGYFRLFQGVEKTIQSYGALLDGKRTTLELPHLPSGPGRPRRRELCEKRVHDDDELE